MTRKWELSRNSWNRPLLCGATFTLASTIFFQFSLQNFRISTSVMLLPVLLLTLNSENSPFPACACSCMMVLAFRTTASILAGVPGAEALRINVPGAAFYIFYGILFPLLVRMRAPRIPLASDVFGLILCDFFSNLLEVAIDQLFQFSGYSSAILPSLAFIAILRGFCAAILLMLYCQYHSLLNRSDHEERYQRLYLMKTHLKGELYFLAKDKARIEQSVKAAYQLHSQLTAMPDVPKSACDLALQIACDIHDLKKDYIRIEQGFHEELGENSSDRVMEFSAVVNILEASTRRLLGDAPIRLSFHCDQDFVTIEHYALMSMLRCLVNNAIESIQSGSGRGIVELNEYRRGGDYCFVVADNGPGISPKYIKSIFEMGFSTKFDPSTGNLYRGMGLPNVRLVAQELGGRVDVRSEPGQRTEFLIQIPAAILEVP